LSEQQKITDEQAFEAYDRLGSYRKAAAELGVAYGTVYKRVKRAQEKRCTTARRRRLSRGRRHDALRQARRQAGQSVRVKEDSGDADEITHVVDPKKVKFTTTVFDSKRGVERQWVREEPDAAAKAALWEQFGDALKAKIERADVVEPVLGRDYDDSLAVYPIGDHHVGMVAWGIETRGDNYDLKLSERMLSEASRHLMRAAPPCRQALICIMGDFVHFDGFRPETPASKHLLDADGRFPKVARTARRMVRHLIEEALHHHEHVHVIYEPGNHDPVSAVWIMELLDAVYENNPRVVIDTHPGKFHYFEWHRNLIMTHHGDSRIKPAELPMILAADMPEAWGRTEHRLILTGHVHHESRKDMRGAVHESVPVLIPNDAYSANAGYRSARAMQVITLDKLDGEVERHTFNAKRFNRRAA
jgi:hypothetical protein